MSTEKRGEEGRYATVTLDAVKRSDGRQLSRLLGVPGHAALLEEDHQVFLALLGIWQHNLARPVSSSRLNPKGKVAGSGIPTTATEPAPTRPNHPCRPSRHSNASLHSIRGQRASSPVPTPLSVPGTNKERRGETPPWFGTLASASSPSGSTRGGRPGHKGSSAARGVSAQTGWGECPLVFRARTDHPSGLTSKARAIEAGRHNGRRARGGGGSRRPWGSSSCNIQPRIQPPCAPSYPCHSRQGRRRALLERKQPPARCSRRHLPPQPPPPHAASRCAA